MCSFPTRWRRLSLAWYETEKIVSEISHIFQTPLAECVIYLGTLN